MKKVLNLIKHMRSWGATSADVMEAADEIVFGANTPAPFETYPDPVNMHILGQRILTSCDAATARRRKGMMNSSHFKVEVKPHPDHSNALCVFVYHVRNTNDDRLYLTFIPVK